MNHPAPSPDPAGPGRWRGLTLNRVATVVFIAVCLVTIWTEVRPTSRTSPPPPPPARPTRPAPPPLPAEPISLEGAVLRGNADAPLVLLEFSDFQCPYCGRFTRDTLPALERDYIDTGKVRLAFRHLPLSIHPFAEKAAESAACAGRQGQFWPMHDALFLDQQHLDGPNLSERAVRLHLDEPAFEACLSGGAADAVARDAELARALGVSGTPAFFLGRPEAGARVTLTDRLSGAQPLAQFAAVIDRLLQGH